MASAQFTAYLKHQKEKEEKEQNSQENFQEISEQRKEDEKMIQEGKREPLKWLMNEKWQIKYDG